MPRIHAAVTYALCVSCYVTISIDRDFTATGTWLNLKHLATPALYSLSLSGVMQNCHGKNVPAGISVPGTKIPWKIGPAYQFSTV